MTNTTSNQSTNKPVFRKTLPGGISAAVFQNTRDGRTYRSVNLQRSYKQNGKWNRMSIYLDHQDIPFMIEVLNGVWNYLNEYPPVGASTSDEDGDPAETEASETAAEAAA